MEKLLTLEADLGKGLIELHLNKAGAEYLKSLLIKLIGVNTEDHLHLMTPDWGGNDELSNEKQSLDGNTKLLHHLKIVYWKES